MEQATAMPAGTIPRGRKTARTMLLVCGILSSLAYVGAEMSATDTRHIIATMAITLLTLFSIGSGAAAAGRGFRLYSIATILALLIFGGLAGLQGPRIAANLPTPWFGAIERVNAYGSMLWVAVLAVVLLRAQGPAYPGVSSPER